MINVVYNVSTCSLVCLILFCEGISVCVQTYQRMCGCRYVIPGCFCPYIVGMLLLHHIFFLLFGIKGLFPQALCMCFHLLSGYNMLSFVCGSRRGYQMAAMKIE